MVTKIVMPQLGTTMTEGTVQRWHKAVGDPVRKGEVLLDISTDKYAAEIESEADGVLRATLIQEGDEVPVLAVLGFIADDMSEDIGEATPAPRAEAASTSATEPAAEVKQAAPVASESEPGCVKASPLARKTAKEMGIDIALVPSDRARIKQADVIRYGESLWQQSAVALAAVQSDEGDVEPLTPMRKVIGARMAQSIVTAPQVTEMREVNAGKLIALWGRINARNPDGKVSYGDILAKMVATALVNRPAMNASMTEAGIRRGRGVHIGLAVALTDGLVVPVIRDVERKGIRQIAKESAALVEKARENSLTAVDTEGATFTISNLGGYGVDGFTPIVNLPECGILGLGRIVRKPVVDENDQVVAGDVMTLSLTFDHRVVDGATAATLLALIADYVEDPEHMLL